MNGKLVLGMLLLVMGFAFAAPNVFWASPTPLNGQYMSTDTVTLNMTTNETFGPNTFINLEGTNRTCTLSADNTSCTYTLNYSEKIFGDTYNYTGFGNVSGTYTEANESRLFYYLGCGYVDRNATLLYDIGSPTFEYDCLTINASNVVLNLDGYDVQTNASNSAIISQGFDNITIMNGSVSGGANAVYMQDSQNSVISDLAIDDTSVSSILLADVNNTNITRNVINDAVGYGITLVVDCYENNISYNSLDDGDVGIYVTSGENNQVLRNNISDHSSYGMLFTSHLTSSEYNTISGSAYGMLMSNSNGTVSYRDHFCGNTVDFERENTAVTQDTSLLLYGAFDSAACVYTNGAGVALLDVMEPNETYRISRTTYPASLPTDREVILNKVIFATNLSAVPVVWDNFVIFWNSTESTAYNESSFELWKSTAAGVFSLQNATLNTSSNFLEMNYLNITVAGGYKIMILGVETAGGSSIGTDATDRTIAAFVPIAIAFFVLFTIIGSFGVMKGMHLEEYFIPIMAVSLIAILVWGLFMQ